MRSVILLLALPLMACNGTSDGSDGSDGTDGTDSEDPYGGCHPLIGEYLLSIDKDPLDSTQNGLCFTLNTTEPCTKRNGGRGTRVYRFMDDGRVVDGNFTGTEKWFWFSGSADTWDDDKVDSLSYSGAVSENIDGADLRCEGCEEVYELSRDIIENQTATSYSTEIVFALDNLNPNGGWQGTEEERNMFVFYARYGRNGELTNLDTDYAKGQYTPDSMTPGEYPASYTWFPQSSEGKCY
ncbi:MAG: hypothetical protein AB8H79_16055 [Myxococcota bacterium]